MLRRIASVLAAAGVVAAVGVGPAGASAPPITGTLDCVLSGTATVSPGLPLASPGPATKPFKTKIKFTGTLSGCTGTNNAPTPIVGGSVVAKGVSITAVGDPLPSCLGLAVPGPTPITLKSSAKFTNAAAKTVGKSTAMVTVGPASLGPPISFPTSGPISKGAFLSETETATAVLDLSSAGLLAACMAPGGLTTLSFTGVLGPSSFSIS